MVRKKAAVSGEERCVTTLITAAKETMLGVDASVSTYLKVALTYLHARWLCF